MSKRLLYLLTLVAVFIFSLEQTAEGNRHRGNSRPSKGYPDGAITSYSTPPVLDVAQFPGVRYWFAPWYTEHSWQETGETTVEVTHVTADGQSFGGTQDPVFGSLTWASSAARRGVSGTLNGRAYYECSATGSNDQLVIQASQDMFRSFHTDRTGTLAFRIDPVTANGTSFFILDSNNLTSAQRGIYIERTTANRLSFVITNGAAVACTHTSVATLTSGNASLVDVIVRYNAGAVEINVGNATEETFTCGAAGSAGSSGQEFTFCGRSSGAGSASMRIGELVISDTRWTDAQVTAWRALTTARTTVPIPCFAPGECPFQHTQYDFTVASTLWEDAAVTDQVETLGDAIHVVRDPRDLNNYLRRQATSVGATHPTWTATNGANWADRASDDLIWQSTWGRAAARTVFTIVDCDDLVYGCRYQNATSSSYGVVTADVYSGNIVDGYTLLHADSGTAGSEYGLLPNQDGRNCIVWQRDGSTWNVGAVGGTIIASTNANGFTPISIGTTGNALWYMNGDIMGLRSYQNDVPQTEWETICNEMGASDGLIATVPADAEETFPLTCVNATDWVGYTVYDRSGWTSNITYWAAGVEGWPMTSGVCNTPFWECQVTVSGNTLTGLIRPTGGWELDADYTGGCCGATPASVGAINVPQYLYAENGNGDVISMPRVAFYTCP